MSVDTARKSACATSLPRAEPVRRSGRALPEGARAAAERREGAGRIGCGAHTDGSRGRSGRRAQQPRLDPGERRTHSRGSAAVRTRSATESGIRRRPEESRAGEANVDLESVTGNPQAQTQPRIQYHANPTASWRVRSFPARAFQLGRKSSRFISNLRN